MSWWTQSAEKKKSSPALLFVLSSLNGVKRSDRLPSFASIALIMNLFITVNLKVGRAATFRPPSSSIFNDGRLEEVSHSSCLLPSRLAWPSLFDLKHCSNEAPVHQMAIWAKPCSMDQKQAPSYSRAVWTVQGEKGRSWPNICCSSTPFG